MSSANLNRPIPIEPARRDTVKSCRELIDEYVAGDHAVLLVAIVDRAGELRFSGHGNYRELVGTLSDIEFELHTQNRP